MSEMPPFVIFFLAAILVLGIRGKARKVVLLAAPLLAGLHIWMNVETGTAPPISFLNVELTLLRVDKLSLIFGYLFCLAGFLATLFALKVDDTKQEIAGLVYVGSTLDPCLPGI